MPDNDAVSKADLQNVVVQLTNLVNDMTRKIITELDRRFAEAQNETNQRFNQTNKRFDETNRRFDQINKRLDDTNKRFDALQDETNRCFHQADRDRRAFHKEVEHRFHEMKGEIMNHFNLAQKYTEETVAELGREVTTRLDNQSWCDGYFPARTNDHRRGVVELRADLEATKERYEAEIKNLKRRVSALEQEVLPSSTDNK